MHTFNKILIIIGNEIIYMFFFHCFFLSVFVSLNRALEDDRINMITMNTANTHTHTLRHLNTTMTKILEYFKYRIFRRKQQQ